MVTKKKKDFFISCKSSDGFMEDNFLSGLGRDIDLPEILQIKIQVPISNEFSLEFFLKLKEKWFPTLLP